MKSNFQLIKSNSGQIVLILVLLTVVGLTIGLSLISRTITDVRISSQIEETNRAFSAAEAGVESALKGAAVGANGTVDLPGASADYSVLSVGGSTDTYIFPFTQKGKTQTVWLIAHNSDGTLDFTGTSPDPIKSYGPTNSIDICWGTEANQPAIIMTLLYKDGSDYKLVKGAYDPNATRGNNFYIADSGGNYCDGNYNYKKTITFRTVPGTGGDGFGVVSTAQLIVLRLQPVHQDTSIAVKPSVGLPIQGKQIISVGQTGTGTTRKIQVTQGFYTLPEIFDFSFFSE